MRTLANDEEHYDVIKFVSLNGDLGREWASRFESSGCSELMRRIQGALKMMWVGKLDEARQTLQEVGEALDEADVPESYVLLLGRWLHGVMAYLHYMSHDFELAEQALRTAEASVRDSIAAEPILMPLAAHCADLRTQGARLARRRRRWSDMHDRLSQARGMYLGTVPFCELPDGTPITAGAILEHLVGLPMGSEEKGILTELFDPVGADAAYVRFERHMYVLPGLVTAYP